MSDSTASEIACLALMAAFDPEQTPAKRREMIFAAIDWAMRVTNHEREGDPFAAEDMLDEWLRVVYGVDLPKMKILRRQRRK